MTALTSNDYVDLQVYANNSDRIGYWAYLAGRGDSYASPALGVATNETLSGYVANSFFLSKAQAIGVTITEAQLYNIGVDLMRADLAARESTFNNPGTTDGGLTLDIRTIYRYHDNVFKQILRGSLMAVPGRQNWRCATPWRSVHGAALDHGKQVMIGYRTDGDASRLRLHYV